MTSIPIFSWDVYREDTRDYLAWRKPVITLKNVDLELINLIKKIEYIPIRIMGTQKNYDLANIEAKYLKSNGQDLYLLLNITWSGYPYTLGLVNILDKDTPITSDDYDQYIDTNLYHTIPKNISYEPKAKYTDIFSFRRERSKILAQYI
jgi:hypothetical protein